jgi:hypothetical protein
MKEYTTIDAASDDASVQRQTQGYKVVAAYSYGAGPNTRHVIVYTFDRWDFTNPPGENL